MEKTWVSLPRTTVEYMEGAIGFVKSSAVRLGNKTAISCPCVECRNMSHQLLDTVIDHLVVKGMDRKYMSSSCWFVHGESRNRVPEVEIGTEAFDLFRTAFFSNEQHTQHTENDDVRDEEHSETKEESEFKEKLREAETPLYSDSPKHTKISAIMGLYRIKFMSGISENYFDQLLMLIHELLPEGNVLPKSIDTIKKFLKIFGFGYETIHACKNDCILYRKEYEPLDTCPRCNASRWEIHKNSEKVRVGIPAKVLRYFPIKDRFKRLFRSERMVEYICWHHSNATEDGTMRHPVDSLCWTQVNDKWPEFAAEPRNLRLGISTDGMNPFSMQNTNHNTWSVLLVNYNTPPTICMKAENIMLTMLIPGPTAPGNNIDIYLAPLIDDLKDLWYEGIEVYDAFKKETFTLKAMMLWSVTDYPALGTLSGCKVKGKQACNVCGKDTPCRWLKHSHKYVYMGNRKRLAPNHPYRYKRGWFDNTVELGNASRIQTGEEIYDTVRDFRNDFGKPLSKERKRRRSELLDDDMVEEEDCEENNHLWRWKKKSIFFDLPYWKELPVRHNIDVMHVEKNVSDAILSTIMQSAKSKDGLKSRKDLEDIGIRTKLHAEVRGTKNYLPAAPYWLSKEEKLIFCKRLAKFRGPDGYCGNIANSVSVNPPIIGGLKSHDHHVLLHNLLHVALRGFLDEGPRIAVNRVCNYFNRLCQRTIDPEKMLTLESEFVETMCQLERFFPPSLFDIMFHLPIHLAREARLGGPVHFRWMYPFERYMKTLKAFVKNNARPEGCMAEGYLARECISFCLEFLQKSVPVQEALNRNEDTEEDSTILEGRPLGKGEDVVLSYRDRDTSHRYILMNMSAMDPYVQMHLEELQNMDAPWSRNETLLWKKHSAEFAEWVKIKIPSNSTNQFSDQLRWLAFGPRNLALQHKGFVINGHRFHTDAVKRQTQNSGVSYEAFSMCRSSARDLKHTTDMVTYDRVVKEIIFMDYHFFKVPIFRCNWANKGYGVKEEDGFTLVNLHMNQTTYMNDPFILPSQAKQVFYSREDDSSNWYVVMRAPPRGYHELETEEDFVDAPIAVQEVSDLDSEYSYVRDGSE